MAVNGVTLAGKHSYNDWGLFFKQAPALSPPEPKTHYVDIPGRDGALDLTETLTGGVKYRNRKISLVFIREMPRALWPSLYAEILGALHGKRVTLVFDDGSQYTGRASVGAPEWENRCVTVRVEVEAAPYRTDGSGGVM